MPPAYWLAIAISFWAIFMIILLTPAITYTSAFDRLTKAKFRKDKVNLQIMLDHLKSFPEEWSIARDAVSYPLQGSKAIYLNYDKTRDAWKYSLAAFDGEPRLLNGHFAKEFATVITKVNNQREAKSLLRNFYPNLDDTTLLLK